MLTDNKPDPNCTKLQSQRNRQREARAGISGTTVANGVVSTITGIAVQHVLLSCLPVAEKWRKSLLEDLNVNTTKFCIIRHIEQSTVTAIKVNASVTSSQ